MFKNDGKGRFLDATAAWWPPADNVGEDDNMVAFLDVDSDGDADFVVGSLSGPDRLLVNDGRGRLTARLDVFSGEPTPGTLGLALADLDGDGRMDVVQGQGEHKTAVAERVHSGRGLPPDTAAPSVTMVRAADAPGGRVRHGPASTTARARAWPPNGVASWSSGPRPAARGRRRCAGTASTCGAAAWPADLPPATPFRVCATDAAGNAACGSPTP